MTGSPRTAAGHGALHASPVAPGPWLFVAFACAYAVLFGPAFLPPEDRDALRAVLLIAYPGALLLTGTVRFAAGRYIAARLAAADPEPIVPALATLLFVTGLLAAAIALGASFALALPPTFTLSVTGIALTAACLLIAANVASVIRENDALLLAFAIGAATSSGAALALGRVLGRDGAAQGFLAGQLLALGLLSARALRGPGTGRALDRDVLRAAVSDGDLAAAGIFLALGGFADEVVFALARGAREGGTLASGQGGRYEDAMLLAGAVAIPLLVVFPGWLVAPFREAYRELFRALDDGLSRADVLARRHALDRAYRLALLRLMTLGAAVVGVLVSLAPDIALALRMDPGWIPTMRLGGAAAGLHAVLLFQAMALAQVEARGRLVLVLLFYAGANTLFAIGSTLLGGEGDGVAPMAAALGACVLGHLAWARAADGLEGEILLRQPIEA